jgi:3'-phosphoadenosine 5'-phosphosulfate (PAPS) 3'-phosphatase
LSRFHHDPETDAYLDRFPDVRREVCGSSVKFGRIAEGAADLHVRTTSISEWDVAPGHAIVEAAGGAVIALDGSPLVYGRAGFRMPPFIVSGDPAAR